MKKIILFLLSILIMSCTVHSGLYSDKGNKNLPKHHKMQKIDSNGLIVKQK